MRYEGNRKNGTDKTIYTFSLSREELEILLSLVQNAYNNTPGILELMPYRGRLRNLHKVFGKIVVEDIKGKKLPTKRTNIYHKKINKLSS